MKPSVSFAITTHNEGQSIQTLLDQLSKADVHHEIVILDDYSTDELTGQILAEAIRKNFVVRYHSLEKDFARHKNRLNELCNGEYIFQIDADETLHPSFLENLEFLLDINSDIDLFLVPRINTVDGLTEEDIRRWNWKVNERGWVMFPDYQTRLYRNADYIKWVGKVHERIEGYKTLSLLPAEEEWCIIHHKDIVRQRNQNDFYQTL